jgi:hypothetical protein
MKLKSSYLLTLLVILVTNTGCGVYSFTGTTITAETISIQNFYNDATNGPADLAVTFTNQLRDYFQQNTSLAQVSNDGELQMEGSVIGYRLSPVAPSAASSVASRDQSDLTRLTIVVEVTYVNLENEDFSFSRSFSQYADFNNELGLTAVESTLIEEIYDQIILDIFSASVANW